MPVLACTARTTRGWNPPCLLTGLPGLAPLLLPAACDDTVALNAAPEGLWRR